MTSSEDEMIAWFDSPAGWRRVFDLDTGPRRWLRLERAEEDGTYVVRAEMPGIAPARDVDAHDLRWLVPRPSGAAVSQGAE